MKVHVEVLTRYFDLAKNSLEVEVEVKYLEGETSSALWLQRLLPGGK